jgi:uncharacterized protein YggE
MEEIAMKRRYALVLAAVGLVAAALVGVGRPEPARSESDDVRRVTVAGMGSVESVPDVATFGFGVSTRSATAKEALDGNAAQTRRVISALRAAGVSAKDIRTEQVSLTPQFDENGRTVVGYTATNSVNAKIDDLGDAGSVVDEAVGAGANQVDGPALSREDQSALYRKALESAVAEARRKAEALADASGASVGRVLTIVEQGTGGGPEPIYYAQAMMARDGATPIEPGTEQIEAHVTVTFELQ